MFGTLRYVPENKAGEFLRRESGAAGNAPTNKPQHTACDNCRVKKIRCSGRRTGCSRCKTLSLPCNYTHVPTRKSKKKPASSLQQKDWSKEDDRCPGSSAVLVRSPAKEAAATAAVQPSVLTMKPLPHSVDENNIGLDRVTGQAQRSSNPVLDSMLEETSTWSSCLDWSPGREGTSMSDSDYPMTGNLRLPADPLHAGYPGSGDTVHGFTPPDLLATPPLAHILVSTGDTNRSSVDTLEITMEEQYSCLCLNSAVFLLDDLQTPHHDGALCEQDLDAILSIYQEVLLLCKRMLNCENCRQKSENMMLLTMVLEQLVILCGVVIDAFIAQREANGLGVPHSHIAMREKQPLLLGAYEIEREDYEVMMGMLMTRRLSELESLLARMIMISSLTRRAHQKARMGRVDRHIKDLFRKLTSVCPMSPNGGQIQIGRWSRMLLRKRLRTIRRTLRIHKG